MRKNSFLFKLIRICRFIDRLNFNEFDTLANARVSADFDKLLYYFV